MRKHLLLLTLSLFACSERNEYNHDKAGKEYCACMKMMGAPQNYSIAADSCDKKIELKYRWYKYFNSDMGDSTMVIASSRLDSIQAFIHGFSIYINQNCCTEILHCNFPTTRSPSFKSGW